MPKRRARVHQGIFQKKSLGLITKGKYSLIGHLLCRVLNWDFVFSSTQMETELVAVSWEKKKLDGEVFFIKATWGSPPGGGGEGGRRGGDGSPGAPSLVARPESGEGWVAPDCLGGSPDATTKKSI